MRLARGEYLDYNDTHFTEELAERNDIMVSSPAVRRLRTANGLANPRKRYTLLMQIVSAGHIGISDRVAPTGNLNRSLLSIFAANVGDRPLCCKWVSAGQWRSNRVVLPD